MQEDLTRKSCHDQLLGSINPTYTESQLLVLLPSVGAAHEASVRMGTRTFVYLIQRVADARVEVQREPTVAPP